MPLRRRLTLSAAVAVAAAILVAAGVCYLVVRDQLRGQVDHQLRSLSAAVGQRFPRDLPLPVPSQGKQGVGPLPLGRGGLGPYIAVETTGGRRLDAGLGQGITVPIDATDRRGPLGRAVLRDKQVGAIHLRTATFRTSAGVIEVARPVDGIDRLLRRLGVVLLFVGLGGVALAAALGRLVGRGLVAPLAEVAEAARHIEETEDLGRRLTVRTDDEVGLIAGRFNAMLDRLEVSRAALDASVGAQRQLVADASHELRTPVTSLRTNVEVLLEATDLTADERRGVLGEVRTQLEELSALIADLIELARGDPAAGARPEQQDVRLDLLAEEAAARTRRHFPRLRVEVRAEPVVVDGDPERLGRALNNLLDNAAKHSPPEGPVEVTVGGDATVQVRDHGAGIAPEDLPHLFDRFYRGAGATPHQGTGLGLAIVKQTAEAHGGSVAAEPATGGGACFTLKLPESVEAAEARGRAG